MIKWTVENLEKAIDILGKHTTIWDALSDIKSEVGFFVNKNSLELAFYRNGMSGPTHYLLDDEIKNDVGGNCINEIAEKNNLNTRLLKLVKRGNLNLENICDDLNLPPSKARSILRQLKEEGFKINVGEFVAFQTNKTDPIVTNITQFQLTKTWKAFFAALSDTHWGSRQYAGPEFRAFVKHAYDLGVKDIIHTGDLGDGLYHKGHEYELIKPEMTEHINIALQSMVPMPGLRYHLITGNHDFNGYFKKVGLDIGEAIVDRARSQGREDIIYYGYSRGRIQFGEGEDCIKVELAHPEGGSAYAKSYPVQKYIERGYVGGDKPHIAVLGHLHTYSVFDVRNVLAIQPACFQWTTNFMRGKGLNSTVGGVIVEAARDEVGINFRHSFIKFWPKAETWTHV